MPGHEQCWLFKQRNKASKDQSVVYRTEQMLLDRFGRRIDDEHQCLREFIEKVNPEQGLVGQVNCRLVWCLSCPYSLSCRVKTELKSLQHL